MDPRAGGPGPPALHGEPRPDAGLPALLRARTASRPEQPWLFVQRGLDWRWHSFAAAAARVERLRAALVAASTAHREAATGAAAATPAPSTAAPSTAAPGGPVAAGAGRAGDAEGVAGDGTVADSAVPLRVGFEDDGGPDAIALDLAIQAAGACAAPLPPGLAGQARAAALADRGCTALALADGGGPPATISRAEGPAASAAPPEDAGGPAAPEPGTGAAVLHLPRWDASEPAAPAVARWAGGCFLVRSGDGWREVAPAELFAEVEELSARLAPPAPRRARRSLAAALRSPRRRREILVLPRPLADPAGRRLAAWSLAAGAVLVLEPDRARLAATAAWVRPTVFAGDPAEIGGLRVEVEARRRPRRGLPLRRLHTVAVLGGAPLAAAERAFWTGRGTAVTVV